MPVEAATAVTPSGLALAELRAALDDVAGVPYLTMNRRELAARVVALQELAARMDAVMAETAAAAHDAGVHLRDSLLSLPAFVAANTNVDPKRVAGDRNLGLWLQAFPIFADAFRAGAMGRHHVQAFRAIDNRRTRRSLVDAQHYLADAAQDLDWREFCEVLRTWVLRADPDGAEPAAQQERRHLTASKRADGTVGGRFELDPIGGDLVMYGIAQEEQRLLRAAGDGGDGRSPAQRRADALVSLVARGAAHPNAKTPAPLVHITMGETVAADLVMRLAVEDGCDDPLEVRAALVALDLDPDQLPLDPSTPEGRCHLGDGTVIHPRLAAAALAAGTLRRLVLSAHNHVLELGTAVRDFPRHFKDAVIAARKGRCHHPGCDAPIHWLQADHRIPHSRNGPTNIANCDPLCGPHNHKKRDQLPP